MRLNLECQPACEYSGAYSKMTIEICLPIHFKTITEISLCESRSHSVYRTILSLLLFVILLSERTIFFYESSIMKCL